MKCPFCNQPAGFMKLKHRECYDKAQVTLHKIEKYLDSYSHNIESPNVVKKQIIDTITEDSLLYNYFQNEKEHNSFIKTTETVLWIEYPIIIWEYKNRKHMIPTGISYERHPVWKDYSVVLSENGRIVLTDKSIYMITNETAMTYDYKKIVNVGYEKISKQAYFDVKTTSPYPHRFLFRAYDKKQTEKAINICLFLGCMTNQPI